MNLKVMEEVRTLASQLHWDQPFKLGEEGLLSLVKNDCPTLLKEFGERQWYVALRCLLWHHGIELIRTRVTVSRKQIRGYKIKYESVQINTGEATLCQ
jgi:hypothetical protein